MDPIGFGRVTKTLKQTIKLGTAGREDVNWHPDVVHSGCYN